MSNLAIGLAIGSATSNSGNNSSRKTHYCNISMRKFNPEIATIKEKQNYADCVEHIYPSLTGADVIAIKVVIIATIALSLFGGIYTYRKKDTIVLFMFLMLSSVIFPFVMLVLYSAIKFLFS